MSDPACHCGASEPCQPPPLDLAALRAKLAAEGGQSYWRSLEAAAETPEFQRWLHREFPAGASEWTDAQSRRQFLKVMAASVGLAGLAACTRQPQEQILPYVKQPEELIPGIGLQYATAMTLGGYATGLLVESHEGRPTKVEGNPDHPMSLGAANVFQQASVLELYAPDRTRTVLRAGETSSWQEFLADLVPALAEQAAKGGAGLRLLTETVTSPTLRMQIGELLKKYPQARWHQYKPWGRDNFRLDLTPPPHYDDHLNEDGTPLEPHYDFSRARVIVALDSDFLFTHPASLVYARQFARNRAVDGMSRLYVAEPTPTVTGTMADHRLACGANDIVCLAGMLGFAAKAPKGSPEESEVAWLAAASADLHANKGAGLVLAGEGQSLEVHRFAYRINEAFGNLGRTVTYHTPVATPQNLAAGSLGDLAKAMHAGKVDLLVQIGGNPAYDAPADLDFAEALGKVPIMRLPIIANGTCPWRTSSNPGATRSPSMALLRSSSRSSNRFTTGARLTSCLMR